MTDVYRLVVGVVYASLVEMIWDVGLRQADSDSWLLSADHRPELGGSSQISSAAHVKSLKRAIQALQGHIKGLKLATCCNVDSI